MFQGFESPFHQVLKRSSHPIVRDLDRVFYDSNQDTDECRLPKQIMIGRLKTGIPLCVPPENLCDAQVVPTLYQST